MVKREELVECIYFDGHEWSCPTSGENCELVDCRECASSILAEYEQKIRADAIDDVERELLANGFIFTEHALEVWHNIAEQLKEKKNE